MGITAAAGVVGGAMIGAANKVAGVTDEIDKASRRAGTTAEKWQELKYAFEQSGISTESLERTMVKNQKALNEAASGGKKATDAYGDLGVAISDAGGSLRDADDVYQDTIKSLADMTDVNERNRIANDLFGKSYSELAPILDAGSDGIEALTNRAKDLGLVMSQETVDAGVKFGDTLADVQDIGGALFNAISAEFLPLLQSLLDWMIDNAPKIQEAVGKAVDFIKNGIDGLKTFWEENGEKITAITSRIWDAIKKVIETAMDIISGVVEVATGIMSGDWKKVFEGLEKIASAVFDLIKEGIKFQLELIIGIIKSFGSLMFSAGESLFTFLWDGLKSVWTALSSWVMDKVEWVADKLTFWKSSQSEMSENDRGGGLRDGSHASGLPFVPYDGYMAELHRGETVWSANSSQDFAATIINGIAALMGSQQGSGGTIVVQSVLNSRIIAEEMVDPFKDALRQKGVTLA